MTKRDFAIFLVTAGLFWVGYLLVYFRHSRSENLQKQERLHSLTAELTRTLELTLHSRAQGDTAIFTHLSQTLDVIELKDRFTNASGIMYYALYFGQAPVTGKFKYIKFICLGADSLSSLVYEYPLTLEATVTVAYRSAVDPDLQQRAVQFCDSLNGALRTVKTTEYTITRYFADERHQKVVADASLTIYLPAMAQEPRRTDSAELFNVRIGQAFASQVLQDSSKFRVVHVETKANCSGGGTVVYNCAEGISWKTGVRAFR